MQQVFLCIQYTVKDSIRIGAYGAYGGAYGARWGEMGEMGGDGGDATQRKTVSANKASDVRSKRLLEAFRYKYSRRGF